MFTLPDGLSYLWPSFAFFHHERSIFGNQESTPFVLAINHPVGGTYMTSRRRVGINRQQWLNTHASHVSADYLSSENSVLCNIGSFCSYIRIDVHEEMTRMTAEHQHTRITPNLPPNTHHKGTRAHKTNNAPQPTHTALYAAPSAQTLWR